MISPASRFRVPAPIARIIHKPNHPNRPCMRPLPTSYASVGPNRLDDTRWYPSPRPAVSTRNALPSLNDNPWIGVHEGTGGTERSAHYIPAENRHSTPNRPTSPGLGRTAGDAALIERMREFYSNPRTSAKGHPRRPTVNKGRVLAGHDPQRQRSRRREEAPATVSAATADPFVPE